MRNAIVIAIAILLTIILVGLATANTVDRLHFFTEGVQVEIFEDGSGRAINAESQMLIFCMQGYPCDHSINTESVYLPMISK